MWQINLQIASESSSIALASHQDNGSLRFIQILTMIFLPGSLISSIFGMGFFSTSSGTEGNGAVFTVSGKWWLYFTGWKMRNEQLTRFVQYNEEIEKKRLEHSNKYRPETMNIKKINRKVKLFQKKKGLTERNNMIDTSSTNKQPHNQPFVLISLFFSYVLFYLKSS